MSPVQRRAAPSFAIMVLGLVACRSGAEQVDRRHDVQPASDPAVHGDFYQVPRAQPTVTGPLRCAVPEASERLPPRVDVLTRPGRIASEGVTTDDLFQRFASYCGGCHVEQAQGGFQLSRRSFAAPETQTQMEESLRRVRSDDPGFVMPKPPEGRPFRDRPAGDPVRELAALLEAWLSAGRPEDIFYPNRSAAENTGRYMLSHTAAEQMTNLGNCIPSAEGFASEERLSRKLDAAFAAMKELPSRLQDTDLFTLDSEELARHGVVAFAPGYTLWADHAKKVRMVRVPRGESIRFDPDTQRFHIPANTRFYKTFLKQVKDRAGNLAYRKLETRLIVARPDDPSKTGADAPTALFGTYAWNEAETEAVLVRDPLKNGRPFRDRLVTYALDEQEIERLVSAGTEDLEAQLKDDRLSRRYAIPGSERCLHCHMGSASQSFVLGFTPLQLRRRAGDEGGVYEDHPAGRHELDQLERLMAYGVISGMTSPADVTLLEASQGERPPRNDYELKAQAYMLGNCAHCHNPRGFPTSVSPELGAVLNFLPDASAGGIFQFPLDRFSPRIYRGPNQNIPIPYITPSLFDLPNAYTQLSKLRTEPRPRPAGFEDKGEKQSWWAPDDTAFYPVEAPWRSLIYRNVDAPFSYEDDATIFPHMPRDTPGYDCRARQLLGDWMISIPALWRTDQEPSDLVNDWIPQLTTSLFGWWVPSLGKGEIQPNRTYTREAAFADPQPYVEARPDEPGYLRATLEADARLERWHATGRYAQCPKPELDIVDPYIVHGDRSVPAAEPSRPLKADGSNPGWGGLVPERSHWFVMDLTQPTTEWQPRRADWSEVLRDGKIPIPGTVPMLDGDELRARNDRKTVYLLTGRDAWRGKLSAAARAKGLYEYPDGRAGVSLTDALRRFALAPQPLGVWRDKPECVCKLRSAARASDPIFQNDARPSWFDYANFDGAAYAPIAPDAKIYTVAPGAHVFNSVCANCHGPKADSRGRMADTIADLTGGDTQVANLRTGFFGPVEAPGQARAAVFPRVQGDDASPDDWAARYLLWMGLGGTQRRIPQPVVNVVATTRVFGLKREGLDQLPEVGANMLAVPEFLCSQLLLGGRFDATKGRIAIDAYLPRKADRNAPAPTLALFGTNGDADFWESVCTAGDVLPYVQTVGLARDEHGNPAWLTASLRYLRSGFPAAAPVGQGVFVRPHLSNDNRHPWCLDLSTEADREDILRLVRAARPDGDPPICPAALLKPENLASADERSFWARRGAMNAGLLVFVYLDALARGEVEPSVEYDQCEKWNEAGDCGVQP